MNRKKHKIMIISTQPDLHAPAGADDEDDGGVAEHRHQGDHHVQHGEQHDHTRL